MPTLVNAHLLSMSFAARPLFEGITFSIESGERIGLIGPNGAGKSTLLKILASQMSPDEGTLSLQRGLRVACLEQVPQFKDSATVEESVLEGSKDPHDWQEIHRAQVIMSELSLDGSTPGITPESLVSQLSGGWKKRVALARELLKEPDLLLLDEPTNHLDVESILELEQIIAKARFATVTVTHDRYFLQRVSTRILELDRRNPGGLLSVPGDYEKYLETKEALIAAQEAAEVRLKNTLRRETEWLRRGAKARTTKQQARIKRAEDLKQEVAELNYRNQTSSARIEFQTTEKNPKKLVEAQGIAKSYDGKLIVPPLDLLITPKSRIGLLGRNGCGKSTLIRLLLGKEAPDAGSVKHSEHLQPLYFEQNRDSLDPNLSLVRTLCPSGDHVVYRGNSVHVKSYLDRFMFRSEQMDMPVRNLSGGEQSRLVIARLMLQDTNFLVLDEPTNDLDMATLNILEEVLSDFEGAVLLVTHDRYFLDAVTKQILAFGEDAKAKKVIVPFAGVEQWEDWYEVQKAQEAARIKAERNAPTLKTDVPVAAPAKKRKLSYKEQRELDTMEETIHAAEAKLAELTAESAKPELARNAIKLTEITKEMGKLEAEIERLYGRWSELSEGA